MGPGPRRSDHGRVRAPEGPSSGLEIDHLIPLGIGGADNEAIAGRQPRRSIEPTWNAERKDRLEWHLRDLICSDQLDVLEAQRMISEDWVEAYGRFFRSAVISSAGRRGDDTEMKAHPYADILPLLEGEAFDALVSDIRANGLMEPITIYQDMILDGRNRLRACKAAGIEPEFLEFDGDDPLAFVLSLNVHRRHLSNRSAA